MSLAWGTVVLLVLLLPGFLFFVGLYLPERFTRDTAPGSAFSQLAAVLLVSVLVHGSLWICVGDKTDLNLVLVLIQLEGADTVPLTEVAEGLRRSFAMAAAYFGTACVGGALLGLAAGQAATRVPTLRRFIRHGWLLDLKPTDDSYVSAYVLTNMRQAERVLMYRGTVESFALQRDGTFAYLVLAGPSRYYMNLKAPAAETSLELREIGATQADRPARSLLVISGEHIDNVVFESFEMRRDKDKAFHDAFAELDVNTIFRILEIEEVDSAAEGDTSRKAQR